MLIHPFLDNLYSSVCLIISSHSFVITCTLKLKCIFWMLQFYFPSVYKQNKEIDKGKMNWSSWFNITVCHPLKGYFIRSVLRIIVHSYLNISYSCFLWVFFNTVLIRINFSKSIWHIDETLTGTTTPVQSGPESNGSGGLLLTFQISSTRNSKSDAVSYKKHSFWE